MRSLEDITALYLERKSAQSPQLARMTEVRDTYNGDIVLPMPELNRNERSSVANLTALGIDQNARRIASTLPNITFPPDQRGRRDANERNAQKKRQVAFSWWDQNKMHMKLYRRARWLVAYVSSPVVVRPRTDKCPLWQLRDPLSCFPAPSLDLDEIHPPDTIFTYVRSYQWMRANGYTLPPDAKPSDTFEILEYVDDEQLALICIGTKTQLSPFAGQSTPAIRPAYLIPPIENRAHMPLAVTPGRVTLDRPQGQFDGILGMYQTQARLMALELIAIERSIFPEEWFVHNPGSMSAEIITIADGKQGIIGEVKDGKIETIRPDASALNLQAIDRTERAERVTAGIPAEYGGESATNIRTGRRGDSIMSATIDFNIQELQLILEMSLTVENKIAIAIDRAYSPNSPKAFYVNWPGAKGNVEYVPAELWTSDDNDVSYSHAGADQNSLIIAIGQRIGQGTMSKDTGMRIDPMIDDPVFEHDQIINEGLEAAMLQGIQQQAANGQIPPHFVARIMDLVQGGQSLADAIDKVQKEAQAAQAQQVPAGAPAAQPGIAQPGAGAEAAIAPPNDAQTNLSQLLATLHRPQQMAGAPAGG